MKESLLGKNITEIEKICKEHGYPRYTARQICEWLYHKHIYDFEEMTNLPKNMREELRQQFEKGVSLPIKEAVSMDGTKKYLFAVENGFIESALIPETERATLCLSTQVGCQRACTFCLTGRQGLVGNLSAAEILNQYASLPERDQISNIVYMGMGEPFDNEENVFQSLEIFTSPEGYGKSPGRITVSTIGILGGLKKFLEKSQCHLAISLHSPFEEERQRLMPSTRDYPLSELIFLLRKYDFGKQRRLTFEYIVFKNLNDTPDHARALVCLLSGIRCRVNLLHFHSLPHTPLQGADESVIERFQEDLEAKGIRATIRKSRGEDIGAACGLLSTKESIGLLVTDL